MADSEITDAHPSRQSRLAEISKLNYNSGKVSNFLLRTLKDRYRCPYFRILVIGRANAGKTTILEKVCSVARGTISMIYDQNGEKLEPSKTHLMPSAERGLHEIEHQITYKGSNFVFHDSQGFESGGTEELELVWKFIEKRSASIELRDQLHAIWYCIPMDSPRPLLSAELEFFSKGTGKVPLVTIFTKFDGQIIAEYGKLCDSGEDKDKWGEARINANAAFQQIYLPKVLNTKHPPKAYVQLEDMDLPEKDCPELATVTAEAIDDSSLQELFVSTQMNNLDLCSNTALQHILAQSELSWSTVMSMVLSKFPHYWVDRNDDDNEMNWFNSKNSTQPTEEFKTLFSDKFTTRTRYMVNQHGATMQLKSMAFFEEVEEAAEKILSELFSSFGDAKTSFFKDITACQILVAINIIAKLSFFIKKPIQASILDALDQFKTQDCAENLKIQMTSKSIPSDEDDLYTFLYEQITTHVTQ